MPKVVDCAKRAIIINIKNDNAGGIHHYFSSLKTLVHLRHFSGLSGLGIKEKMMEAMNPKPLNASIFFTFMLWAALVGLVNPGAAFAAQEEQPKNLPILQQWSGDYPVSELHRLPKNLRTSPVGYLADVETFAGVWQAFKPNEKMPEVDFKTNLVVFTRNVDFYNRTSIGMVKLADGVLEIVAMETMSALPIEDKVAMAMAVIPRAGVRFIQAGQNRIPVTMEPVGKGNDE